MAKGKEVPTKSGFKNSMIKVKCPSRGMAVVWANVGPKSGAVCTACGQAGHDKA